MKTYFLYSITNLVNDFVYVGITADFEARRKQHLWQLRNGRHDNKQMQSDFILYGETCFEFNQISRKKYATFFEARQAESNEIFKHSKSYNTVVVGERLKPVSQNATEPKLCTANPLDYFVYWRDEHNMLVKRRCGINRIKDLSQREEAGILLMGECAKALRGNKIGLGFKVIADL